MSDEASTRPADQPFTFGGVGRFAHSGWPRFLAVAAIMAAMSGTTLAWFFAHCWAPVFQELSERLPEGGAISGGRLAWPAREPFVAAGNSFLGLRIDPSDTPEGPRNADLWIELRLNSARVRSLFGWIDWPYPAGWSVALGRSEVAPRWGAWQGPGVVLLAAGGAPLFLMVWGLLAAPLCLVPRMAGLVFGRDLTFRSAWKLAVAAHWPGALLMCFAIVLYGLGQIGLVLFTALTVAHSLVTWAYLIFSPLTLGKRLEPKRAKNPFRVQESD